MYGNPHAREWHRVMAVNVRSHFLGCKYAQPVMTAGGSIVLIFSTAARLPATSNAPAYVTSKAALDGLRGAAGREAAPRRIRVNIVMPGLIDTPLGQLATLVKPDRPTPRSPRPAGHRPGGREQRDLPALRPGRLHHRPDPGHRRRAQRTLLTTHAWPVAPDPTCGHRVTCRSSGHRSPGTER